MCHISREKSGTIPGGMKTISFQQVRSAPKSLPFRSVSIATPNTNRTTVKPAAVLKYTVKPAALFWGGLIAHLRYGGWERSKWMQSCHNDISFIADMLNRFMFTVTQNVYVKRNLTLKRPYCVHYKVILLYSFGKK